MVSFAIAAAHAAPPVAASASAAGWPQAATLDLAWDVVQQRPSSEKTTVRIATDGAFIYVRFDASQREPITALQHSNDVGQGNDDAVWIDLWPGGNSGFRYQFQVTPNGTHYESSSENTSYAPDWESHGAVIPSGYVATMKIPLSIMHGVHGGNWKAQFVRYIHATGEEQIWSFDSSQTNADDVVRAGELTMPLQAIAASRAKPRIALYGLGEVASRTVGGSTSRSGVDLSVPITSTSSFYATLHPDFSNVELDQQSISPSVYQRFFNEVRPFFTQGSSFYNRLFQYGSNWNMSTLYSPSIPTPREGYALEGKQGQLSFAGFEALGNARSDVASVLDYSSPDTRWRGSIQRSETSTPSLVDDVTDTSFSYYDLKHVSYYATYGTDGGTNVSNLSDAQWYDGGVFWGSKTFVVAGGLRKIGDYYNPVDGFTPHPGVSGYAITVAKVFDFAPKSEIVAMDLTGYIDRYQGKGQGSNQSDNQLLFDVLTKSALNLQLFTGSDYWRFGNTLTPISQSGGFSFTYHSGLQTNSPGSLPSHGSSATPTTITYNTGRYGDGRLDTWFRSSTIRAGSRGLITLTLDNTSQWLPNAPSNIQWFDSVSYTDQISAESSVALGLRRVIGKAPVPNGGGNCVGACTNVSLAYHYRLPHSELYVTYGDPNALYTAPQAIVKLIFYGGADKGA